MSFKANRKTYLYILIYISLAFLLLKLYQANYLKIPDIQHYSFLGLSFVFLFLGMLSNTLNWKAMLAQNNIFISIKDAIISVGICIFTKYIPGKLLMVLGRAEHISQNYNVPLKATSSTSLQTQLTSLWVGTMLGFFTLLALKNPWNNLWNWLSLGVFILLSAFIFLPLFKILIEKIYQLFFNKMINIPHISTKGVLIALPYFFLNWILWSISFYCLIIALSTAEFINIFSGFSFTLAGSLGILAIIAPGGIGVREAILTYCLSLSGIEITEATTIAVASRLWFLIGEGFLFLVAFVLNVKKHPS